MKNAFEIFAIIAAAAIMAVGSYKPSVPALQSPERKAISNVGDAPDYKLSAAAAAGNAKLEIASLEPAATAPPHDALNPEAVVSLSPSPPPTIGEQMLSVSNSLGVCRRESAALTAAAQGYADYLVRTRQQGHYANGSPEQRARAAGFTGTLLTPGKPGTDGWTSYGVGEVLCFGGQSVGDAFDGWLHSPGHKAALYEASYDVAGFGQCGTVWVGMFGNSRQRPAPAATAIPAARPATFVQNCPSGFCGQAFVPQQPRPRQYVQQPQQWQYQRLGLFGWRTR